MKSGLRKAATLLLAAATIIAGSVFMKPVSASAASLNEVREKAVALTLGQATTGALQAKDEGQWYSFEITEPGYFNWSFSTTENTDSSLVRWDWRVGLYSENDIVNAITGTHDTKTGYSSENLPLGTGKYYICVMTPYNGGPIGAEYAVKVDFTPSNVWEQENNNSNVDANAIALNTRYYGNLWNANDVDFYKFETTKNGKFKLDFAVDSSTDTSKVRYGWDVTIMDSNMGVIKQFEKVTSGITTADLPYAAGTFYVQVKAHYNGYAPILCNYNFEVDWDATSNWEAEYNNDSTVAKAIPVNKVYYGTMYEPKDEDWYSVNIKENGVFKIQLSVGKDVSAGAIYGGWAVSVYDKNYKLIKTYTNITGTYTTPVYTFSKGKYYIKVCAAKNYGVGYAPVDCKYGLNVKFTKTTAWESEYNDASNTADAIAVNKTYSGTLYHQKDVDFYKFTLKAKGVVDFKFTKDKSASTDKIAKGWNITIYNSKNKELKKLEDVVANANYKATLAKGTYYIKVESRANWGGEGYSPLDCVYNMAVNYSATPAAPKIKSVAGGKKQETVTWEKVKGATGYYVYRSTSKNGKYAKVGTVKKDSTVKFVDKDKKLKAKTTYFYKVVAYTTTNKVTATSGYSAIKSAKTK